jgi:hypothetical protein
MVAVQNLKGEIIQLISSTNKTDCHDIIEILLKMALNTIKPTNIFGRSNHIPSCTSAGSVLQMCKVS